MLLYLLGIHFGLRAADEHKNLKIDEQFKVLYDDAVGLKYIYYEETTSKCHQGGISDRNVPPKTGRAYQNIVNSDRCVVRLFEKYVRHRPTHNPKCSRDFYLRLLSVPQGDIWYSCQARGVHSLQKVVKNMCTKAGFSRKHTNHSCRASTATRLYEQGCDEQLICEKMGHHSVAVRSYKRTSGDQLRKVSNMLYGYNSEGNVEKKAKIEPCCTVSKAPEEVKVESATPLQEGSKIVETKSVISDIAKGVTININVNVNK